ncbi:hypothetical protein D6D01_07180 [Aureobasidium pullulans]|uniref:Uncharacterized protein n=1 Tax=Aureobasidium pullulans TaxID=5580 RepID=A0A4S9KR87_AURPU|nr:hypothetical protein D6D01_07180 [Aureobasidium pullulans]
MMREKQRERKGVVCMNAFSLESDYDMQPFGQIRGDCWRAGKVPTPKRKETFSIPEPEYAQLVSCLEEVGLSDFYHNEVRYATHLLDLPHANRPSRLINDFVNQILFKVAAFARSFEQDFPAISQRLLQLRIFSTTDMNLLSDEKSGHKLPDASVGYSDRVYPHVVFEVSCNQARKALDTLAWSYIMDSSHSVRCVVGLDLKHPQERSSPSARAHNVLVSVWRPLVEVEENIENMDVKQETTHQSLGQCDSEHAVAVCEIVVTSKDMIEILKEAELIQENLLRENQTASWERQALHRNWRKRRISPGDGSVEEVKRIAGFVS